MKTVHLIRHAEPNVTGVLLGRTDAVLGQAAIPPSTLSVRTVLASPLQRSRRTAGLLFPNHRITVINGLAERDLGEWEGHPWAEVERVWPESAALAGSDWLGTTPPGGESWVRFVERVSAAWTLAREFEMPTAIVAHAGVNAALAQLIAGRNPADFRQAYLEVLTFELEH